MRTLLGNKRLAFLVWLIFTIIGTKDAFAQTPSITTQPANQTVAAGQTATFTVAVSGGPCRSYWFVNGAGYYGPYASAISYSISNTTSAMNGWQVYVNLYDCGSAGASLGNSQAATLTVTQAQPAAVAPVITTEPASQTVTAGQTATFSVATTGTAPLSYQWEKNGANISGATSSSYTTPATTTANSGSTFSVVVSNSAGTAASSAATLTVNAAAPAGAPSITQQPQSQIVQVGQTATFTTVVSGGPCRSYWFVNGAGYYGSYASTISYSISNTTSAMNGWQVYVNLYDCGSAGTSLGNSQTATLTVTQAQSAVVAPVITTEPASQTVTAGQTATFSVATTGTGPLTYQWEKNGANISGATSSSYTTPATTTANSGSTFSVAVSNSAGSATSSAATLTVNADTTPPTVSIASPAAGATVSGTISVTASASDKVGVASVQLQVDGTSVGAAGATSPYSFSLNTTTLSNGSHSLTAVAIDVAGNQTTSAAVAVTVSNTASTATPGPLAVCTSNPRYFCDPNGNVVFLGGDHTWADGQDLGNNKSPNTGQFDFNGYMTFMSSHGYTWMRLWEWMYSQECCATTSPYVSPVWPWVRAGSGYGDDGLPATDFTQLNSNYFSRLRARVIQAGQNGVYVSVMLFSDVDGSDSSADGDPFVSGNNVNGVNCAAPCPVSLPLNSTVWSYEQAYIHKVVDTVHDLPNAMYEIANEPPTGSASWVAQVLTEISTYEQSTYGTHHPIGLNYGNFIADSYVYNTNADYVSPSTEVPPAATGQCPAQTGNGGATNTSSGRCKVVINDSDHSYYYTAMQSDGTVGQTAWAWKNFTLGNGVAFMDPYTYYEPNPGRNNCTGAPTDGDTLLCATDGLDPQWNSIRQSIGDIVAYARKIDLKDMTPQQGLFGSGYGLASTSAPVSYLMFSPNGSTGETIDTVAGTYTVEVFDTNTHAIVSVTPNVSIGSSYTFNPPGSDNYAVWIH